MKRWLVAILCFLSAAGCSTNAAAPQGKVAVSRAPTALTRELSPMSEHAFNDDAAGISGAAESTEPPTVDRSDGLVRVNISLGTAEPVRCYLYTKPLNLAQTLRMFVNHVAESVEHQDVTRVNAGEIDGIPFIAVHTTYVSRPGSDNKPREPGQLKYLAARGESSTTVCMHDEAGYNETFERVVKRFVASEKFADGRGDPAAKLVVWRDVSVARAGSTIVGVVEHRLYEGEVGYAYASATSYLLPVEDGKVLASDEVDNQFSDTQGGIVEATYIKIMNDSVAYNMALHYDKGVGYHIDGVHNGGPIDIKLAAKDALPDYASQTAVLRHLFASPKSDETAHWVGFSPDAPEKLVTMDFTKKAADATHKRGVLITDGKPSEMELDNLGTPTEAKTPELTVRRVWQAKGDHR